MDTNDEPGIGGSSDNILWEHDYQPFERQCLDEFSSAEDWEDKLTKEREMYEQQMFARFQDSATAIAQLYRDRHHPVWLPFQSAALALTNMYKACIEKMHCSLDVGKQTGRYIRTKEVLNWLGKQKNRHVRREEVMAFLCGKTVPTPARGGRRSRHSISHERSPMLPLRNCSHNNQERGSQLYPYSHGVGLASPNLDDDDPDFVQFQDALGRGAVSEVPKDYRSHNSSTSQDLHEFIKEEAVRHKDLRKRTAPVQEFDATARKRSRML